MPMKHYFALLLQNYSKAFISSLPCANKQPSFSQLPHLTLDDQNIPSVPQKSEYTLFTPVRINRVVITLEAIYTGLRRHYCPGSRSSNSPKQCQQFSRDVISSG
jgi:hypothetical protein